MTIPQAFDLAVQHHQAGRLMDAEALYRQILAVQPNHAGALHLLGVVAQQVGRHDAATDLIRQSIVLNSNNPDAHFHLGDACRATGRPDEAVAAYRHALRLKSDFPEALNNLGDLLRELGQLDEAVAMCQRALVVKPGFPEALNNLGAALAGQGRWDEATIAYRQALQIKPDLAIAHYNLGAALSGQGQFEQAIPAYRRALDLQPNYSQAELNLGAALAGQGQLEGAIAAYRRALGLRPGYPQAWLNLGIALREQGQFDDAMAAFRRALELKPDYTEAHNDLAAALAGQGQIDEAVTVFRRALALKPEDASAHSNLVYTLHFHPGYRQKAIDEERRRWNRQFGEPLKQFISPHCNDRNQERRLRIGYVSPDFWDHVVGRNLMPLFQRHDRRSFEILCYAGVARPDHLTKEFRRHSDQWRSTVDVGDEALAEMIRRDGVDILVDLTQHMAGNRLPVFARKPAPVQASFAGYPESTGLEAIEYRISDRYLEAASAGEKTAGKEIVCLIDSFWCYDPCGAEVKVNPLPALDSGTITFGNLGSFRKINDRVLSLWARVLGKAAHSRLLISSPSGSQRERTLEALRGEGVESHRVEFVAPRPRREYLGLYHRLDIVLDTTPYNGHTTSLDALWMGVPLVTLAGDTPVSRAGLSQLSNLGLPELVAHSEAEYVNIAGGLAANLPRLTELRSTLRQRMETSVLMDAARFARNIEAAYRSMWEHWRLATVDNNRASVDPE